MEKKTLRTICRYNNSLIKRHLTSVDFGAIFARLKELFIMQPPSTILLYESLPHEVSLDHIKKRIDARYGNTVTYIIATKELESYEGEIDYAFVPGIAFDEAGARLGQGGGWYDKFFAEHSETYTMGICYKEQLLEQGKIPLDEWDVVMDEVFAI